MFILNLTSIFKVRGIERPYTFLVKAGLSPHTATSILSSSTRVFRLDHIELICEKLNCTPNDLLMWKPDKNKNIGENHSLTKLKRDQSDYNIHETLKTIPLDQLNEIASILKDKSK